MSLHSQLILAVLVMFCSSILSGQQIANYVTNGSFENIINCNSPLVEYKALGWSCIDSTKVAAPIYSQLCGNAPNTGVGYQMPQSGNVFLRIDLYCPGCTVNFTRSNLKNRLKANLHAGKTYCVKGYVNRQDMCTVSVDEFGFYFGDSTVDTIIYNARLPLTFLSPQVSNPQGNFLASDSTWMAVTGTFVANGTEKYMVIANFKSDAGTDTIPSNFSMPGVGPFGEYFIDGFSCIDVDLPAYAGNDTMSVGSNSVYIGRPRDVGIDEDCMWYKLPIVITPTTQALDTAAGIWVCPPITSTYVVRQEICGNVKWDTVVVWKGTVGFNALSSDLHQVSFYPNPASDILSVRCADAKDGEVFSLIFFNTTGKSVRESQVVFRNRKADLDISELDAGVYCMTIRNQYGIIENSKLVIAK